MENFLSKNYRNYLQKVYEDFKFEYRFNKKLHNIFLNKEKEIPEDFYKNYHLIMDMIIQEDNIIHNEMIINNKKVVLVNDFDNNKISYFKIDNLNINTFIHPKYWPLLLYNKKLIFKFKTDEHEYNWAKNNWSINNIPITLYQNLNNELIYPQYENYKTYNFNIINSTIPYESILLPLYDFNGIPTLNEYYSNNNAVIISDRFFGKKELLFNNSYFLNINDKVFINYYNKSANIESIILELIDIEKSKSNKTSKNILTRILYQIKNKQDSFKYKFFFLFIEKHLNINLNLESITDFKIFKKIYESLNNNIELNNKFLTTKFLLDDKLNKIYNILDYTNFDFLDTSTTYYTKYEYKGLFRILNQTIDNIWQKELLPEEIELNSIVREKLINKIDKPIFYTKNKFLKI